MEKVLSVSGLVIRITESCIVPFNYPLFYGKCSFFSINSLGSNATLSGVNMANISALTEASYKGLLRKI